VVLAAGKGRRLQPLTRRWVKPLLPILDRPLLAWQLGALRAAGLRETIVVVEDLQGPLAGALPACTPPGLTVELVLQREPLGIAHALLQAAPLLQRPFLCLLGDVFFEPADLLRLVATQGPGQPGVLGIAARSEAGELARNYAVELDEQGWVTRVWEKPTDLDPAAPRLHRGVGLYAFRPDFLADLADTPVSALRGERELTDAVALHIERGGRLRSHPLLERDFNLSGPADLLAANLHALGRSRAERWIAPDAEVAPGARVVRSLVGSGARVAAGADLERCLVLPGERVPAGRYRDALLVFGECLEASSAPGRE